MSDPNNSPIAVQINLHPTESGLLVRPFSVNDGEFKETAEIGEFVIPWHELPGLIERMEQLEKYKLDVDSGAEPF